MSHLLANLTHFARLLRELGLPVTASDMGSLVQALGVVGLMDRPVVKAAGRALLVHRREHLAVYDRAFDLFWSADRDSARMPQEMGAMARRVPRRADVVARHEVDTGRPPGSFPPVEAEGSGQQTWSERERLWLKDFSELTDDETQAVRILMQDLRFDVPPRRTRRTTPDRRGRRPDLRATIRRSLRHGGEPIELRRRSRVDQARPMVVLCDISGSMAAYSRVLLQLVYAVGRTRDRVEAFAFGTRLTRLTRQLRQRSINDALRDATDAVVDWGGGTRIGDSLRAFNWQWARRVLRRGAVVLLISDGWDRGDPGVLRVEMARLRRSCHRLIWLNPLLAQPDFAPLTAGLRAALPHVDDFLPIHNLASLEQLAAVLLSLNNRGRRRNVASSIPNGDSSDMNGTERTHHA